MTEPEPREPLPPRTDPAAWAPLACALVDYEAGDRSALIEILSDDGIVQRVPVSAFSGGEGELPAAEAFALGVCRGHVLDVGAGSGRHALELQSAGAKVTAIDASPKIVELMRARGVRDARVGDVFEIADERFDTLLLLMNGVGVVGTLRGLDRFLIRARDLLNPGGQILFDSFDLRSSPDARTIGAIRRRDAEGAYFGEVTFRLRYAGREGTPYPWLFVDAETLTSRAAALGWHVQLLFEDEDTTFVARLVDATPGHL